MKTKKEYSFVVILLMAGVLTMTYASVIRFIIEFPYPKSYREMTMIKYAVDFSRGINPYSAELLNERLPFNSGCYGFLQAFLTGVVLRPFPISRALTVAELFSCLIDMASTVIVYLVMREHGCRRWIALTACLISVRIVSSACTAYPHSLGMMLLYLLVLIVTKDTKNERFHPFWYAVIVITAFYAKQYFLIMGPCVFGYLLLRSPRNAVKLAVYGTIIGLASLYMIDRIFPLYLPLVLVRAGIDSNMHGIAYVLKQIVTTVTFKYPDVTLLGVAAIVTKYVIPWKERQSDRSTATKMVRNISMNLSYEEICMLISFLPISYISRNHGQFCEYYEHLMIPYAIVWGCAAMEGLLKNTDTKGVRKYVKALTTTAVACAVCLTFYRIPVANQKVDLQAAKKTWQHVEDIIERESPEKKIIVSPLLSNYCMVNGIYTDDYGQAQYNSDRAKKLLEENAFYERFFPEMQDIVEMTLQYRREVQDNIHKGYYDVIALSSDGRGSLNYNNLNISEDMYQSYGEKHLSVGQGSYSIKIYLRR